MKKTIFVYIFSFFLVIFIVSACDNATTTNEANQTEEADSDTVLVEENNNEAGPAEDADLVLLAYMNNQLQQQMSEIAAANTQSEPVRELAQSIMQAEREIQVRIEELAQTSNKNLPAAMSPDQVDKVDSLQNLSVEEFDEAYLSVVVKEYKENSERLDELMSEGDNPMTRGMITDIKDNQEENMRKAESLLEELS